jgi:Polyketide cyclase / dehydrase and lipid transport
MDTFQNTVTITRPAGEVFAFLAELRNIPRWNYAIARTVPTSPGPARVGATYRQTCTIPRPSEENLKITVFQPPTRLAVQGQIGPFQATTSYLLESVAAGTRLTNDVKLEPVSALLRPIGPLAAPRIKAAVARNLRTLKGLLESGRPAAEDSP